MNRTQYRTARRMIRDNGRYALRWLDAKACHAMEHLLFNVQDAQDWLAERADIVGYCRREGLNCNPRMTGRL
jgi:hypothetical protein